MSKKRLQQSDKRLDKMTKAELIQVVRRERAMYRHLQISLQLARSREATARGVIAEIETVTAKSKARRLVQIHGSVSWLLEQLH